MKKIEKKFLTESYSSLVWLSSRLLPTMPDINLCYDKKLIANHGYSSLHMFQCVKIACFFISKEKQNRKCENVVPK